MKPQFDKAARAITVAAFLTVLPYTGPVSPALAQISLPPVNDPLNSTIDPLTRRTRDELDTRTRRRVDEVQEATDELPVAETVEPALASLDESLDAAEQIAGTAGQVAGALARPFVADFDSNAWTIEKNVLVVLVDDEQLAALNSAGFDIVGQWRLPSLGLSMLTLRDTSGTTLPDAAENLRKQLPGIAVDFNHVYRFADDAHIDDSVENEEQTTATSNAAAIRIGMIDSAVDTQHFSLRDSVIVTNDFVSFDGERPLSHGTAVASIIARSSDSSAGIFAASVFFATPNHAPGASTESLVAALDWLVTQDVDVINMSLTGPANALLERALEGLAADGPPVIAAVGNNGPSGPPLYPAAYDGVVGVTATDRDKKIFRYANRGPHVDFAAFGVNVKVADAGAGWLIESGTSMASPHVAVVIAQTLRSDQLALQALLELLSSNAEDLGSKGFDPVFGYGLITQAPQLLSGN
ncbi:MAG: S8 family serine peptidase [Woeseiaceae bacterium]